MDDELFDTFIEDGEEHLESINNLFVSLEEAEFEDEDLVEELLRELHSFKGSARMVGARNIETISHSTETIVKNIQSGNEKFEQGMMNVFLEVVDVLQSVLEEMKERQTLTEPSRLDLLQEKLELFLEEESEESEFEAKVKTHDYNRVELEKMDTPRVESIADTLDIDTNLPATELIDEILRSIDSDEAVSSDQETNPPTEENTSVPDDDPSATSEYQYDVWNPDEYEEGIVEDYLGESLQMLDQITNGLIELEEETSDETINTIFRSAHTLKGSSGMIGLALLEDLAHDMEELLDDVREGTLDVSSDLIDLLLLCRDFIEEVLETVKQFDPVQVYVEPLFEGINQFKEKRSVDTEPIRNELELQNRTTGMTQNEDVSSSNGSGISSERSDTVSESIRVNIEKLDDLINLIGEMVINRGQVEQKIDELKDFEIELEKLEKKIEQGPTNNGSYDDIHQEVRSLRRTFNDLIDDVDQSTDERGRVESELQESIMRTRMVPVADLFNKFPRLVRDLSQQTGKEIDLQIQGKQTELDKTVIEQISDPLMHIVRNSIDHGLESPDDRRRAGKPPEGTLRIQAKHKGDLVVIEIEDDGRGIQTEAVKKTALDREIVTEAEIAEMNEEEIRELIFEPGFSTQEEASETSGRGVGMDVVRSNIRDLNGSVIMRTTEGEGTKFTIKLPLTVAIIQVLLVKVQQQRFALPVPSVSETLQVPKKEIRQVLGQEVFEVRGQSIPILRLSNILGLSQSSHHTDQDTHPVVMVESEDQKLGILVDELLKEQEIVIKNLGTLIDDVQFASGATIMGDGKIVLIVDVGEIIQEADNLEKNRSRDEDKTDQPTGNVPSSPSDSGNREYDNQTVLVVEDNATQRQVIHETLESAGFRTITANNGREGLDLARENKVDFVTSDIRMPEIDGYEFTDELRNREEYTSVPILLISSLDEKIDKMRGFDVGADGYLEKPFDEEELLKKVKDLLRSVG